MARLSPQTFKPQLSFRFRITFSVLSDIPFYGKAINLPSAENNPLTIEYGNTYIKVKGKTRWNDIQLSCYAFEGMTYPQLWSYLRDLHQKVDDGKDYYADQYKNDIQIHLLNPLDTPVGLWTLIGGFIASINYGDLDRSAEEVVQPQITIAYDYALYEDKSQPQA